MGYYLLVKKSEITKSQINEYREKNLNEVTWQKKTNDFSLTHRF